MSHNIKNIRNFSIIAHIDHGKSTVSDRLIQFLGGLEEREMENQVLDSMDLEKERGITIKAQTVRLKYNKDGEEYILNLMDTPGHVDFGYEVSRCLAACEGAILLVDATQGVEAQTLANAYKAIDANNDIIPVLNKIDLPSADVKKASKDIENSIGISAENITCVSGKTGAGIPEMIDKIIAQVPHPKGSIENEPLMMLIDAWYDTYLGVILLIKVIDGEIRKGDKIKMLSNNAEYQIENIGFFTPKKTPTELISAGEIGYITANIKNVKDCNIGDTIVIARSMRSELLPGFKKVSPVVFCGIYPTEMEDYHKLKSALEKLTLNDSSINYQTESSVALGVGFRCGFLGLLHLEITTERVDREFDVNVITTSPSVIYKIYLNNRTMIEVENPIQMPDYSYIDRIEEPIALLTIFSPKDYLGEIIKLCTQKRGVQKDLSFSNETRANLKYEIPLSEIVFDFHDRLKSISQGYASFEWEILKYQESDIIKVAILLNSEPVDPLAFLCHRTKAESRGRALCEKLKEIIPQHLFTIPIQAAIGGKIVARETISALRKDVTAKCYGGDITRKKKLLEKQKKGKKRMKQIGSVEVPQSAFLSILKISDN